MLYKKHIIILIAFVSIAGGIFYIYRPSPQLEEFAQMTREDPLFYSPFFDTDSFNSAVIALQESEEKLKQSALRNISLSKENYVESYTQLIQDTPLFPTDFLTLLPEISKETEEFNAHPTTSRAKHLISLYKNAQEAYEKDSRSMVDAFTTIDKHIPDNRPVYYFFVESATSVQIAQKDFDLIYQNSLALKNEIVRRQDCLSGKGSCTITAQKVTELEENIAMKEPVGANVDFIRNTLSSIVGTDEINGTYEIDSPCWGSTLPQSIYSLYPIKDTTRILLPKLANESYYRLVSPKATDAISKKIMDMGLQFYAQPEATTYECSDLTFYPRILTLDFINAHASSTQDFTLLWQNQFGLLAPALQSLTVFTHILEASQRISADFVLSPQFLFTTRSAYSITYLPFAQSVWRIDQKPTYLLSEEKYKQLGAPQQFKTLTQLKREGFSEEDIQKSQINQKDLIDSLAK